MPAFDRMAATLFLAFGDRIRWVAKPATYHDLIGFCYREFHIAAHDASLVLMAYMEFPQPLNPTQKMVAEVDPSVYHLVPRKCLPT